MKKFHKFNTVRSLKGEGDEWIDIFGEDDGTQWWLCGWRQKI